MIDFGPQIAIVDDKIEEVQGIWDYLTSQNIGFKFYNADIVEDNKPIKPIESVELIFLDLYYLPEFDAYLCAEWINSIIPENKLYELVIWSKDSHKTDELIQVLIEINKSPRYYLTKQKSDYQEEKGIKLLLEEIETEISLIKDINKEEFLCEIIDIENEYIVLNCLIDEKKGFFQIRKFEISPLKHFISLEIGNYLILKVTTSLGQRLFEYIEQFEDYSYLFNQKNIFGKFKDTPLTND